MSITKGDILFSLALILAIWFIWTGMVWTYAAALVIAYPAGLISLGLWKIGRKTDSKSKRYKTIPILLIIGLALSLSVLGYMLLLG